MFKSVNINYGVFGVKFWLGDISRTEIWPQNPRLLYTGLIICRHETEYIWFISIFYKRISKHIYLTIILAKFSTISMKMF